MNQDACACDSTGSKNTAPRANFFIHGRRETYRADYHTKYDTQTVI